MNRKVLISFFCGLGLLTWTGCGGDSGKSNGGNGGAAITKAQIPGEATLETGDEKTITRFSAVEIRNESIPGNEFAKAPEGKVYMIFKTEIENAGKEDLDVNSTVYRLKTPSGEIINYTSIGGDEALSFGSTLTPGAKKAGELSFEVPAPTPGQEFVILWKPSPFDDKQAQFTYVHK